MNDNQENNFIKSLTNIIHKHAMLLVAMSQGLQSTMSVALNSRRKCSSEDCEKTATWETEDGLCACDRHMASKTLLNGNVFDETWQEVDDSDQIREIEEFLIIREQMGLRNTVH